VLKNPVEETSDAKNGENLPFSRNETVLTRGLSTAEFSTIASKFEVMTFSTAPTEEERNFTDSGSSANYRNQEIFRFFLESHLN